MASDSRVTGNVSGTPFAIDAEDDSILGHDDFYDMDRDAIEADDPLNETDRTPLTQQIARDREDVDHDQQEQQRQQQQQQQQQPQGGFGPNASRNMASGISGNYLSSHIPGEDRRAPVNTLDESVWQTLSRDLLAVWEKMRQVLWPKYLLGGMLSSRGGGIGATERGEGGRPGIIEGFGNGVGSGFRGLFGRWPDADTVLQGGMSEGLRNWDLWGPLIFCLLLSMFLAVHHHGDQASLVFSGVFCLVWIGEAIVTAQIKLLGGNISFFQSVSIIGYTIFPLVVASALSAVGLHHIVRIPIYIVLIAWSMAAGISILGGSGVVRNRVTLAVYPLFLFYVTIGCLCFIS